jgi:hypothetical protein
MFSLLEKLGYLWLNFIGAMLYDSSLFYPAIVSSSERKKLTLKDIEQKESFH